MLLAVSAVSAVSAQTVARAAAVWLSVGTLSSSATPFLGRQIHFLPPRAFATVLSAGAVRVALAAPAAHTAPDTIAQCMQACTACHGNGGVATNQGYFPRIACKPAGYLFNQMLNSREGRRNKADPVSELDVIGARQSYCVNEIRALCGLLQA